MKSSPIILSSRYAVPDQMRVTLDQGSNVYGHEPPSPDELGGVLDFADWRGQPVGAARFLGRWTLLYFGYSRCTGSCTEAIPLIVRTASELRVLGYAANAAFVDIEASPLGIDRISPDQNQGMQHGPNWDKRFAMQALAKQHGPSLLVLSGNRKQLAEAGIAYHVIREHIPPRPQESGHSINHSSMIYFVGPDTLVAGYGYHDTDVSTLVETIRAVDAAPRRKVDTSIFARRVAGKGCGPVRAKEVGSVSLLGF
jgi:protein SCO1